MSKTAATLAAEINALLGSNAIQLASQVKKLEPVATGLLPFDILLHGGFPRGRMAEVYGAPSALKSYVGLCAIREAQQAGAFGALIDTERTFDSEWAERIGIDLSRLLIWPPEDDTQPVTGEMAVDAAEAMLRSRQVDVLVFDSVAATLPQSEHAKRLSGESVQPGRLAALMSLGLRKLTAANTETAILWINQLRNNIGVTFGNPESPPGGKALPYYASIRVNIKAVGKVNASRKQFDGEKWVDGKTQVAQKFRASVEKSKLFQPHGDVIFTWLYDRAEIDELSFLVAQGLERGSIQQNGAMWQYGDLKVRGRENFLAKLPEHPELLTTLEAEVRGNGAAPGSSA
jgi:recombination protein RecA